MTSVMLFIGPVDWTSHFIHTRSCSEIGPLPGKLHSRQRRWPWFVNKLKPRRLIGQVDRSTGQAYRQNQNSSVNIPNLDRTDILYDDVTRMLEHPFP